MSQVELKVPDIGDFKDIPVIEILVKVGDTVALEQSVVTLESDKATMEVPADTAGVVKEIRVKLGDKVSQGVVVAVIDSLSPGERAGERASASAPIQPALATPTPSPQPSPSRGEGAIAAKPTSNAKCSCSVRAPAATARPSVPPIWV